MVPPSLCRFSRWLPWRSAAAGWVVTTLVLMLGVPLFICMPPWNDVTLHDMAVRSILNKGVHYRDVFDTNLPGIDWAMAVVRMVGGWSYELLRAVDLTVMAAITAILMSWIARAGANAAALAWFSAAIALFYPFSSEFNHMQRDPWLLLPAVLAGRTRLARATRTIARPDGPLVLSFCEGMVWGLAVWIKPHVLIPAATIYLVSLVVMSRRESGKSLLWDLAALILGGGLVGTLGVSWLVATGAWPYFLDVFFNWNPSYLSEVWGSIFTRFLRTFTCFRPWSIIHFPALVIAFLSLWESRAWFRTPSAPRSLRLPCWLYAPAASESVAVGRALLAAFYLGWLLQATVLQKGLDYVQVPLLLLAMAMVASQSWIYGCAYLIWFLMLGVLLNFEALEPVAQFLEPVLDEVRGYKEPLTNYRILRLWPRCWREGGSPALRDELGQFTDIHCGTNWEELEAVKNYLLTVQPPLKDGELNCWHDSTHPLYLMLHLEPATRFMHYGTAFGIRKQAAQIAHEVASSRQRLVVSDLLRMTYDLDKTRQPPPSEDSCRLPAWFPTSQRNTFPWNQPIVFRCGRYLVHRIENPLGEIDIPDWFKLDELGPGER